MRMLVKPETASQLYIGGLLQTAFCSSCLIGLSTNLRNNIKVSSLLKSKPTLEKGTGNIHVKLDEREAY